CRYCSEKFCAEHRLPENHDCEGLDEKVEEEKKESKKEWFEEKESKEEQEQRSVKASKRRSSPSISNSIVQALKSNYTLAIISFTVLTFIMQYTVPGFWQLLILDPSAKAVLFRPWTLVTVMLLHGGPFHLMANMITFYFFGTPVEKLAGSKELLKLYIGGGVVASISYVAFRNVLHVLYGAQIAPKTLFGIQMAGMPTLGAAVGASGAVVAFVGAVAMLYPEAEVLLYFVIPMRIKTAVYAFGGMEIFNLLAKLLGYQLPVIGMFASSAHLAGLAVGLWYGKKLREKHRQRTSVFNPLSY
ncbi:MAG: rhomboid family intramembrane serine protease, partial [Candidatus Nanohalobium sp.]